MRRRRFLQIAAATAAAAALPGAVRVERARWTGIALGADCSVTLCGPGAAEALAALPPLLDRIVRLFSLHAPNSSLAQLNTTGRLADPAPEMCGLLALCDRIHRATGGWFDPTVEPLWQALATGGDRVAARAALGWDRVALGRAVQLGPGQALTLNGIAQGFASDLVRTQLARAGFTQALVNIGEYAALGGPWRLGLADPAFGLMATRTLSGGAVATSSPAALRVGGEAHILNPLEAAAPPLWSTVSVEADSAALADGLSTALCFAPPARIRAIRAALPGTGRITLVDGNGDLTTL